MQENRWIITGGIGIRNKRKLQKIEFIVAKSSL